jgi:hypothetical protein
MTENNFDFVSRPRHNAVLKVLKVLECFLPKIIIESILLKYDRYIMPLKHIALNTLDKSNNKLNKIDPINFVYRRVSMICIDSKIYVSYATRPDQIIVEKIDIEKGKSITHTYDNSSKYHCVIDCNYHENVSLVHNDRPNISSGYVVERINWYDFLCVSGSEEFRNVEMIKKYFEDSGHAHYVRNKYYAPMLATFCNSDSFRGYLFTYCEDHAMIGSSSSGKKFMKLPTVRKHILCKDFELDKIKEKKSNYIQIKSKCIRLLTNNYDDDYEIIIVTLEKIMIYNPETSQKKREITIINQKDEKIIDMCMNGKYVFMMIKGKDEEFFSIDIYPLNILKMKTLSLKDVIDRPVRVTCGRLKVTSDRNKIKHANSQLLTDSRSNDHSIYSIYSICSISACRNYLAIYVGNKKISVFRIN